MDNLPHSFDFHREEPQEVQRQTWVQAHEVEDFLTANEGIVYEFKVMAPLGSPSI